MINFLKYRTVYFLISATVIAAGLLSIFTGGLKYSVEFTGGTNLEYKLDKNIETDQIKKIFERNEVDNLSLRKSNDAVLIKAELIDEKKEAKIKKELEQNLKTKITVLKSETVGPVLGKELKKKTLIAAGLGIIVILIYITYAFKNLNFALAAIGALFHDILVVIGVYSLLSRFFGAEVDTLFVTALLTTMSFSVHDTIVIFDKIREYIREQGRANIGNYVNKALTETMVRSLNNSMTIIFMLLALTLLGGSTIRFFIITLLIGTITGTYSSPFVAAPLLMFLEKKKKSK